MEARNCFLFLLPRLYKNNGRTYTMRKTKRKRKKKEKEKKDL